MAQVYSMVFEVLQRFLLTEFPDKFIKSGLLSYDVIVRYNMYAFYMEIYKGNRRNKTKAIKETAVKFKCSTITVRRAIQLMES